MRCLSFCHGDFEILFNGVYFRLKKFPFDMKCVVEYCIMGELRFGDFDVDI